MKTKRPAPAAPRLGATYSVYVICRQLGSGGLGVEESRRLIAEADLVVQTSTPLRVGETIRPRSRGGNALLLPPAGSPVQIDTLRVMEVSPNGKTAVVAEVLKGDQDA